MYLFIPYTKLLSVFFSSQVKVIVHFYVEFYVGSVGNSCTIFEAYKIQIFLFYTLYKGSVRLRGGI